MNTVYFLFSNQCFALNNFVFSSYVTNRFEFITVVIHINMKDKNIRLLQNKLVFIIQCNR